MGFRQMLKILESYKFIEVKQASKAKERNLGENCKIKILINLLEIKNTLNCHESFSKYF